MIIFAKDVFEIGRSKCRTFTFKNGDVAIYRSDFIIPTTKMDVSDLLKYLMTRGEAVMLKKSESEYIHSVTYGGTEDMMDF